MFFTCIGQCRSGAGLIIENTVAQREHRVLGEQRPHLLPLVYDGPDAEQSTRFFMCSMHETKTGRGSCSPEILWPP